MRACKVDAKATRASDPERRGFDSLQVHRDPVDREGMEATTPGFAFVTEDGRTAILYYSPETHVVVGTSVVHEIADRDQTGWGRAILRAAEARQRALTVPEEVD